MHVRVYSSCVYCLLVLATVWAAPLTKENKNSAQEKRNADKIQDQEKELEQLVSLAGSKAKSPDTAVQQIHQVHYESKNGNEVKHEKSEEKVTNVKTGAVVSDVEQDVTQTGNGNGTPDTEVDTRVDIPDEGVHKEYVQHDDTDEVLSPEEISKEDITEESIEFTPVAVADYLFQTGEFDKFNVALADLVNASVMTQEEADNYKEQVYEEYKRLLAEMGPYGYGQPSEAEYYPEAYGQQDSPQKRYNDLSLPNDLYNYGQDLEMPVGYQGRDLDYDKQLIQEALVENRNSISDAIDSLLEVWWSRALESGDPRAQALVRYLWKIVTRDNNPHDMDQIKEILGDMLANALMEDLTGNDPAVLNQLAEQQELPVSQPAEELKELEAAPPSGQGVITEPENETESAEKPEKKAAEAPAKKESQATEKEKTKKE